MPNANARTKKTIPVLDNMVNHHLFRGHDKLVAVPARIPIHAHSLIESCAVANQFSVWHADRHHPQSAGLLA